MTALLIIIGSLFLVVSLLICRVVITSLKEMQDPDSLFVEPSEEIENSTDTRLKKFFNETDIWTKHNGFKFARYIDFSSKASGKTINCVFWINGDKTRTLCMYYVDGKTHFDFVTKFENDRGLTTSSSKDSAVLPTPPGNFSQFFTRLTLNEIWQHHQKAEKFIEKNFEYVKAPFTEGIIEEVKDSIIKQEKFITRLFLWQLRGPYWFFVRRNIVANKPAYPR